jgi:two-component sensor histidine kinase
MIGETRQVSLETEVSGGMVVSSEAVSIGLIVTESVINALKYAFPPTKTHGRIIVAYGVNGSVWELSIADNGVGKSSEGAGEAKSGQGHQHRAGAGKGAWCQRRCREQSARHEGIHHARGRGGDA